MTDWRMMNSPAFYDCIVHVICNSGCVSFRYNGSEFRLNGNDVAVISQPRLVSDIKGSDDAACEYIVAPYRFLQRFYRPTIMVFRGV